jgi:hypothetical protein
LVIARAGYCKDVASIVKMLQAKAEYETLNDTARHEMQLTA